MKMGLAQLLDSVIYLNSGEINLCEAVFVSLNCIFKRRCEAIINANFFPELWSARYIELRALV